MPTAFQDSGLHCPEVLSPIGRRRRVLTGGSSAVPTGSSGFQRVPAGSNGFQRVPAGSNGFEPLRA
eukprot:10573074-Alexandrium_andersonii.AAC.1